MVDLNDFFHAITAGEIGRVQEYLEGEPELVNAHNQAGLSAVLAAAYYQQPEIARLLVQNGADLNVFEASAVGSLEQVQAWCSRQPELVDAVAPDGFQPLGLASFFGHRAVALYLLDQGAQVNSPSHNPQKVMPLHSAVAGGHLEIARALLEHEAQVNAAQAGGFTPLHGAAQNGQVEMVRLLLDFGADVNVRNMDGKTPLDLARAQGHAQLYPLLAME